MSRIRIMLVLLSTAALAATGAAAVSADPARAASGAAVSVWETTADQSQLLAPQAGATFAAGGGSASQTITVSPATTYQTMTGFGASFTDSSAWLVANSPLRNSIMTKLFDPAQGIGLDFLRQPVGASDFSRSLYSYDDMPAGQTDPSLANFSISHDTSYILPPRAVATFTWTPGSATGGGGSTGISSGTWYQVVNAGSGKCVDATNGGTANGTTVQQWTCASGNTNQEWQFQPTDSGYDRVVTRNAPTLGWDVTGGSSATGDGAAIQLWAYGGGTNQQWLPVRRADGSYSLTPRNNSSECLDVTNDSTANGAPLQQWTCTGGSNQNFTLTAQS
jgi:hypothetical protein